MKRGHEFLVVGEGHPKVRHRTYRSADREAHRLARLCPGQEFLLVEVRKVIKDPPPKPVQTVQSAKSEPALEPSVLEAAPLKPPKSKPKRDGAGPLSAFIG